LVLIHGERNTGDAREGFSLGIHSLSEIIHEPGHDPPALLCAISGNLPLMIKTQTVKTIYARFMEFSFSLLVIFPDHGKMVWGNPNFPAPKRPTDAGLLLLLKYRKAVGKPDRQA
jgi:hypothetical protein